MTCTLCGLASGNAPFCCAGCENVHAILVESGAAKEGQDFRDTELFRESLRLGLISNPEGKRPAVPEDAETREEAFQVSGMWCASCGWLIEHALSRMRGVRSAEVAFASDLLRVRYCPQYVPPQKIVERVRSLGYNATESSGMRGGEESEKRDLLLRLGLAAFLWMNVMTFSLVVYAGYFDRVTAEYARCVPFLLMALATPAVFYCAAPVLRIAWAGVRNGALRMESLLAMGIVSAYSYSAVEAFAGGNRVYFDTVCAIVTLVLAGKAIERGGKERTARAITMLYRLMPNKARLMVDGRERFVSLQALRPGEVFRVKSGERIPADGVVVEGRSHADESVITGESAPRPKNPGDAVICGSINSGGVLEVRATRVGADSTLARILRAVEAAAGKRTGLDRAVDRMARIFIPSVLLLALATFAGWEWRSGEFAEALMRGIAVLVIACPCALGIATPLALTAAVAAASRRGILVADTRVVETIRQIDVVVLDKTGTATTGEFALLEIRGDQSRMAELAALESRSEHLVGRAVAQSVGQGIDFPVSDFRIHAGMGVTGEIGGARYYVGNRCLAGGVETATPGQTTVYFGWDGEARGSMIFGDRVRQDAAALCAELRRRGIRTALLSGDGREAVEAVAAEIGCDEWRAGASPEEKAGYIRSLQEKGLKVAMVGDGVNDAPSLAQADLGIAMGSGADIAMQAAPLVLMSNSLSSVTETLDLARRTFRIVRQNLFWALLYNAAGITMAMAGVLNPILAAGAMALSSLTVIGNSRRLA